MLLKSNTTHRDYVALRKALRRSIISTNKKSDISIFTNKPVTKIHYDITYPEERQLQQFETIISKYGNTQWLKAGI